MNSNLIPINEDIIRTEYTCHLCANRRTKPLYLYQLNQSQSEILECIQCKHLFISPIPLVKLEDRTMDAISDAEFDGNKFLLSLHENLIIKKEIKTALKLLNTSHPTLLDIGCGTGWTTAIWQKYGFNVTGLEPSIPRNKIARERYGLNVSNAHIENFVVTEKFDVVILRHLLEHIENPSLVLSKIHEFLKPTGLLVIILPNINSIGRHIFKEHWEWVLPWHLHFYTPKTLAKLLANNKFEVVRLYQTPSPLWYPHSVRNKFKIKHNGMPKIFELLLCSPIILLGAILNLNDNITSFFRPTLAYNEKITA